MAAFVGVAVREGVGVSVHVGRIKVPVRLAALVAVIVAVDEGRAVILAVLVSVGVSVEVVVFEGVGETILTVDEAVTSSRTGCGVRLGGRGIGISRRLVGSEISHPANPTETSAMIPTSIQVFNPSFIAEGELLIYHHSSRVFRLRLQI